jgi:hypothetical protein
MTSELITFNHLRCHSSSTALELELVTKTRRGTDETAHNLIDREIDRNEIFFNV